MVLGMGDEVIVVIGLGEVGMPIYEIALDAGVRAYGYDADPAKRIHELSQVPRPVEFMHVAFPCRSGDEFVDAVVGYARELKAKAIVIHSTVVPGTTRDIWRRLGIPVAYSPVRGKHPNLKRHLKMWPKWVASADPGQVGLFVKHLEELGFEVKTAGKPETLELAKLWETVYRAVMIASWQEVHRIAREVGANLKAIAEFVAEVHEVLGDRPVYYPGFIGGHCLIPNTKLLAQVHPSKLFEFILESNGARWHEVRDPDVLKEVNEVKEVWRKLANTSYYGE